MMKVQILGKEYQLTGDIDHDRMKQIAVYVDGRMREVGEENCQVPLSRLAILTCLNITDELLELKSKTQTRLREAETQINMLLATVDKELKKRGGQTRKPSQSL